jgi:hypothetical protein
MQETLPMAGSGYTNSDDDSGGGLAKKSFSNTNDSTDDQYLIKYYQTLGDNQ